MLGDAEVASRGDFIENGVVVIGGQGPGLQPEERCWCLAPLCRADRCGARAFERRRGVDCLEGRLQISLGRFQALGVRGANFLIGNLSAMIVFDRNRGCGSADVMLVTAVGLRETAGTEGRAERPYFVFAIAIFTRSLSLYSL